MEITFGRGGAVVGSRPVRLGAPQLGRFGEQGGQSLAQENARLRAQVAQLTAALAQRDALLKKALATLQQTAPHPTAPRPGVPQPRTAPPQARAPQGRPPMPVAAATRPAPPQMVAVDEPFTAPSGPSVAKAWYGGHLAGTGYEGLESAGIGIEDALGLD